MKKRNKQPVIPDRKYNLEQMSNQADMLRSLLNMKCRSIGKQTKDGKVK